MIPPVIIELDELPDPPPQLLGTGVRQQIYARLQRLVKAFELSVRRRMVRRAANVPDMEHPQVVLEGVRQVTRPVV
jgi:hypothetical protein